MDGVRLSGQSGIVRWRESENEDVRKVLLSRITVSK